MRTWPDGREFAFTIIDDTDEATVKNVKPIYDLLYEWGILTTKTVWAFPSRDEIKGDTVLDNDYAVFVKDLSNKGYEIAFHGAGSGAFSGEETIRAQKIIKEIIGDYPTLFVNHAHNPGNLYWNEKRFSFPFNKLYSIGVRTIKYKRVASQGEIKGSQYFWGDFAKEHIKYIRNRTYSGLDTMEYDKLMPYRNKKQEKYSNYWFSSSDGYNCSSFVKLLSKKNIDRLACQKGCGIVYTHFAYGFVDEDGMVDANFIESMRYLSEKNGWFVPASEILDFINGSREGEVYIGNMKNFILDMRWFGERVGRKIFGGE